MTKPILLVVFLACCILEASAIQSSQRVKVEFRLAQTKPDKALTEATIETTGDKIYLHKEVILNTKDIVAAQVAPQGGTDLFVLNLDFTDEGAKKMEKATRGHQNELIAFLIDGHVVCAPLLKSIVRDKAQIYGQLHKEELDRIVEQIASQLSPRKPPPSLVLGQRKIKIELRLAESAPQKGCHKATLSRTLEIVYLHKDILISNKDVVEARAARVRYNNEIFEVQLTLTKEGGERMARASVQHMGKRLAELINGKVISVAWIIGNLSGEISVFGEFTKDEAEKIANELNKELSSRKRLVRPLTSEPAPNRNPAERRSEPRTVLKSTE